MHGIYMSNCYLIVKIMVFVVVFYSGYKNKK